MVMDIASFLDADDVLIGVEAGCKRRAFRALSDHAALGLNLESDTLFGALMEREQLGTTAIGHGIAIPHAKVAIDRLRGYIARLENPVDFDAVDQQPVDLVFLLLAPETATADHLKALSRLARLVRSDVTQKALRGADTSAALYAIATGQEDARAA